MKTVEQLLEQQLLKLEGEEVLCEMVRIGRAAQISALRRRLGREADPAPDPAVLPLQHILATGEDGLAKEASEQRTRAAQAEQRAQEAAGAARRAEVDAELARAAQAQLQAKLCAREQMLDRLEAEVLELRAQLAQLQAGVQAEPAAQLEQQAAHSATALLQAAEELSQADARNRQLVEQVAELDARLAATSPKVEHQVVREAEEPAGKAPPRQGAHRRRHRHGEQAGLQ